MGRTYESALRVIESRRRVKRPLATAMKLERPGLPYSSSKTPGLRGIPSIVGMVEWLQQIGHSLDDIDRLNIIHVAGTKGKGSTCSFTESLLRAHGQRTGYPLKTGLYTSPHLLHPEERIRLNGIPINRPLLAKYFFEIYDRLPQLHSAYDPSKDPVTRGPRNLQLYALLAFHVFIREQVDVAIMETHSGGEYDATNVIQKPVVTAITTLGMDHIAMLGPTLESIAWHKAGIFKRGAAALSTGQEAAATEVLRQRAGEKGESVRVMGEDDEKLPREALQLRPDVQRKNAALAVAAAETWLERCEGASGDELSAGDVKVGIEQWSWPGRFQIVRDGEHNWFLDAAHNDMSVAIAAQWFAEMAATFRKSGRESARMLIFSHMNESRDAIALLETLAAALREHQADIQHVVFTSYDATTTGSSIRAKDAEALHRVWKVIHPNSQIWDEASITGAIDRARSIGKTLGGTQTLITGSQHLVGPSLHILQASGKSYPHEPA